MKRTIFVVALLGLATYATASSAQTLKTVKDRGSLICGVSQGLPAFSNPDDKGNWTGFDVDFCRAIAAAALGDASKVKFTEWLWFSIVRHSPDTGNMFQTLRLKTI